MLTTVTMAEAQAHLPDLVAHLASGDELIITQDQKPVARLVRENPPKRKPRKAGNCVGMIKIVADDDEHLKDFEEYM
jgi:antitoxin (DNA-binding transcriptional repressor) of toxin-antitoxin stability system